MPWCNQWHNYQISTSSHFYSSTIDSTKPIDFFFLLPLNSPSYAIMHCPTFHLHWMFAVSLATHYTWTQLCFRILVFVLSCKFSSCKQQILCYHCLLVVAMTASRRLVSLGTKLCMFVYHVKQVNNKQKISN